MENPGELTTKALIILKTYLECGCNKAATARKLNKSYSAVYGQLNQPYIRNIFQMLLLERGITFDKLATVLKEGLNSQRAVGIMGTLVPDYKTRHKYLDTALNVFCLGKQPDKIEFSGDTAFFIKEEIELIPETKSGNRIKGFINTE